MDFYTAVNNKILFIVPLWIIVEDKAKKYGINVDTPLQLSKFIKTLNNHYNWYSYLRIDPITEVYSLIDARYKYKANSYEEKELVKHFQQLLKEGSSRTYFDILYYHFLAGMTCTNAFDDIKLWGMVPSSQGILNPDINKFMTQVRIINKCSLPKRSMICDNLLIRHSIKNKAHMSYNQADRAFLGAKDEFQTIIINDEFQMKIAELKSKNCFNVCIFDDYMNYGNSFNSIRNLLEYLGVNKLIFVSIGVFREEFIKNDYEIKGDVYRPNYNYTLNSTGLLNNFTIKNEAKQEIKTLYEIFNS